MRWVGDDAFISFRYALNLARGHGLVYNVGERVEGYTNFLWTVIISGGMKQGLDPISVTWTLSIAAYAATVGLLVWLSWKLSREDRKTANWFFPLTAFALLLHHDQQVWSTSGLETSLLTFLVAAAYVALVTAESRRAFIFAGLLMTLAVLTRPDAIIFYVMGAVGILLQGRGAWKPAAFFLLPLVLTFVPYWFIRWDYYGYPFPNTYYAKSADQAYFTQGWRYLRMYVEAYPVLLLFLPAAIAGSWAVFRGRREATILESISGRSILFSLLMILPYTFQIVKVGGDFMWARFFIPLTPLIFFLFESCLYRLVRRPTWRLAGAAVIAALVLLRFDPFVDELIVEGVADERQCYPREEIEENRRQGEFLKGVFAGTDAKIGYYGTHAVFAYYSEAPYALECATGLTDTVLAHQPLAERGRVGHEKAAPLSYLLSRKINFLFKTYLPERDPSDRVRLIYFKDYRAFILTFENSLMDHLARFEGVSFYDFREAIDDYIGQMDERSQADIKRDYEQFRQFYFDVNDDPVREQPFLE